MRTDANLVLVRKATKRVRNAIGGMHPVDAMASLETVVANLVADYSRNLADANAGLDALVSDMRNVLKMRFPGTLQ